MDFHSLSRIVSLTMMYKNLFHKIMRRDTLFTSPGNTHRVQNAWPPWLLLLGISQFKSIHCLIFIHWSISLRLCIFYFLWDPSKCLVNVGGVRKEINPIPVNFRLYWQCYLSNNLCNQIVFKLCYQSLNLSKSLWKLFYGFYSQWSSLI